MLHAVKSRRLSNQTRLKINASLLQGAREIRVRGRPPLACLGFEVDVRDDTVVRRLQLRAHSGLPRNDCRRQGRRRLGERPLRLGPSRTQRFELRPLDGRRNIHDRRRIVGRDRPLLHSRIEEGEQLIVFALGNRIVFVIMTPRAADGQPHPHRRRSLEAIGDILDPILLINHAGFPCHHVIAVEPGRDLLLRGGRGQQIPGELFDRKLIERHVAVECLDDPVTPGPDLTRVVTEESIRVGIARRIEPVGRHPLAKGRRCQQAIDGALVRIGSPVGEKCVELRDRGRKTRQIE
jgi:hypothetical protein